MNQTETATLTSKIDNLLLKIAVNPPCTILLIHTKKKGSMNSLEISPSNKLKLNKVRQFIEQNFSENFTIRCLAKLVGTNEHTLKTCFKAQFGITVFKYCQKLKMAHAYRMLTTDKLSVKEVAYQSGYSNIANFSNAFKAWYGYPPSRLKCLKVVEIALGTTESNG